MNDSHSVYQKDRYVFGPVTPGPGRYVENGVYLCLLFLSGLLFVSSVSDLGPL